jgi:C-terminal processing protease CtpA/Prc
MLVWKRVKLRERCEKMRRVKNVPWVILLLAGFAAGSTVESHARIQSTPTSTSELHRQLDLFGEVLQRVRSDYVEKPNDAKLVEAAINGMLSARAYALNFLRGVNTAESDAPKNSAEVK